STHYMDEAIQCDNIAYIAYGHKLIDAPAADIPGIVGLVTWRVEGRELMQLGDELTGKPGIEQIARFGAALHVSGIDGTALDAAVEPFRAEAGRTWTRQPAGLEEVFIQLMAGASDNYAAAPEPEAA
ncbi:MAG TPA: ABC transporter ATP-binding protein, partial [Devosiaceae bacterium]|nr:ABC transporter ATP-binding protein [Devosiaceae bacterium]